VCSSDLNTPFGRSQQKTLGIVNDEGIYTNLGLLLSDQCMHTIKLAVFQGTDRSIFRNRREFSGSLFTQFNEVTEFVGKYNQIHAEIKGMYRIDTLDYPMEALREALLNVLVHRDYSFSDSAFISIFDNRIEFTSIGGLVKGLSYNDIMQSVSVARNKKLANVFYRLTLIEAYGTGIQKIMQGYSGLDTEPEIVITDNVFRIILPNINEIPKKQPTSFNESEHIIMDLFADKDAITRKDVEVALSLSHAMAARLLKGLIDKGAIQAVGSGNKIRYTLKK
jgi:ATP-dependent DNA helicase RecG